ncbi:hypothetical protein SEA_ENYGMA_267 [Streptomyces phage Enygma]
MNPGLAMWFGELDWTDWEWEEEEDRLSAGPFPFSAGNSDLVDF